MALEIATGQSIQEDVFRSEAHCLRRFGIEMGILIAQLEEVVANEVFFYFREGAELIRTDGRSTSGEKRARTERDFILMKIKGLRALAQRDDPSQLLQVEANKVFAPPYERVSARLKEYAELLIPGEKELSLRRIGAKFAVFCNVPEEPIISLLGTTVLVHEQKFARDFLEG